MSGRWQEKDILITIKTYPEYSSKYTETVCTCGILAETGQMIRIYPIRFRYLDGVNKKQDIMAQLDMLSEKKDLELLPYRFVLKFNCDHELCKGHEYSILDWEISELYRKTKGKKDWELMIKKKIMEMICGPKRETYLLIGNMSRHPHIFCILGFFWPPKQRQLSLDFG